MDKTAVSENIPQIWYNQAEHVAKTLTLKIPPETNRVNHDPSNYLTN